ncbi:MAG: IS3 family transposase, partial [Treponema sp.]|nr:IS3 family transposase [Treponema sp.]
MSENRGRYTVREMAGLLGVSCSAYYTWAKKDTASGREEEDAELVRLIREIVEQHHWRYGSPRVRETLRRDYGKRV